MMPFSVRIWFSCNLNLGIDINSSTTTVRFSIVNVNWLVGYASNTKINNMINNNQYDSENSYVPFKMYYWKLIFFSLFQAMHTEFTKSTTFFYKRYWWSSSWCSSSWVAYLNCFNMFKSSLVSISCMFSQQVNKFDEVRGSECNVLTNRYVNVIHSYDSSYMALLKNTASGDLNVSFFLFFFKFIYHYVVEKWIKSINLENETELNYNRCLFYIELKGIYMSEIQWVFAPADPRWLKARAGEPYSSNQQTARQFLMFSCLDPLLIFGLPHSFTTHCKNNLEWDHKLFIKNWKLW